MLSACACAALLDWIQVPFLDAADRHIQDARLRATPEAFDKRVVIVDIDEASLAAQGRWPWPRETMAALATRLTDDGHAAVVGFDMVMAEPDRDPAQDQALASALRGRPVVLGYYFTSDRGATVSGALPAPVMQTSSLTGMSLDVTSWTGYGANIVPLQGVAAGFFNPILDPDGKVRALPLMADYGGELYESFAVAVLRRYLGNASLRLSGETLSLEGARATVNIPVSRGLSALVPFAGGRLQSPSPTPSQSPSPTPTQSMSMSQSQSQSQSHSAAPSRFLYLSATDVLAGHWDASTLRDRIVLVGTTAPGLTDLRATPLRATFPGVEIHATLIAGALDPAPYAIKQHSGASEAFAVMGTALCGILLAFGLPVMGALGVAVVSVLAGVGMWLGGALAWSNFGLFVPVATGMALVAGLALINLVAGYFIEGRARRAVAGLFGEYVSPLLVERMMRDPARYGRTGSENRELTVLFVDIRGFTRIAETMQPEQLREYINAFLSATLAEV